MRDDGQLRLFSLHSSCSAAIERVRERLGRAGLRLTDRNAVAGDATLAVCSAGKLEDARVLLSSDAGGSRVVVGVEGASSLDDATVCDLLGAGAADLLDLAPPALDRELRRLRQRLARWRQLDAVAASTPVREALVGETCIWRAAVLRVVEAATSSTRPVLLCGETGTGKEEAARVIHDLDTTRDGPFVVVDCASIVESLSGSELWGHRRGSFTGADRDRDGAIARADRGTLFLDEIGELKPSLQVEFLRVLQEGTYTPVGDDRPRQSRFRLVSATHRDLEAMVRAGSFRADLYYRISTDTIRLPALRERLGDVPALLRHFLCEILETAEPPEVDPRLERFLRSLPYEGNVRQLRGIAQGLAGACDGDAPLTLAHLPRTLLARTAAARHRWHGSDFERCLELALASGAPLAAVLEVTRSAVIRLALQTCDGSATDAAAMIGVSARLVQLRRAEWRGGGTGAASGE